MRLTLFRCLAFLTTAALAAAGVPGDAQRGEKVLRDQNCITCHSVNGRGGSAAPDLGRRGSRELTPSLMVSLMWNHAPQMWTAMDKAGIARPSLNEQDAADLFAYFFSLRYFEPPGDGGRGKALFVAKQCAACHATGSQPQKEGPSVESWPAVENPVELARSMWNHAPKMTAKMRERGMTLPLITPAEMTDLSVYFSSLTRKRGVVAAFSAAAAEDGKTVFETHGCSGCHYGNLELTRILHGQRHTFSSLAASMWNHAPKMLQMPPEISSQEMRALVGYLWSNQYFEDPGKASRGAGLFAKKGCAGCHESGAAPKLTTSGRKFDSLSMASSLWRHGPAMLSEIQKRNLRWPRFENSEMQDVIAYLNSGHK